MTTRPEQPKRGISAPHAMRQLAALLRGAGAAHRVQLALTLPGAETPCVVALDEHDAVVVPALEALAATLLADGAPLRCVDDTGTLPPEHVGDDTIRALAVARVCDASGAMVGHLLLTAATPRHWSDGDRALLAQGASLAQAIVEATARERSEFELRTMTASLEESEVRMARIVNSAMDAIISTTEQREIVIFNAAAERIFRVSAADAIGTSIDRFLPPALRDGHARKIREFAATGATTRGMGRDGPLRAIRADGEGFPIEATISRTEVNGTALLTVILRDVTEREKLEGQFRQSQKMEAMGRLAGGVAHDFNNLLTVIQSGADFLLEDLPPNDARRADVEEILGAAERAAGLTRQLLTFSRKQVLETRVLDLNAVILDVERLLRRVIGDDVDLRVHLATDAPRVLADAGQLEQIFMNLAVNARDAMPDGGVLHLQTTVCLSSALPATLPPWPQGAAKHIALVSMRDSGTGMTEAVKARVFEPFFTTKDIGRGTGLGLSTVYGIVEQFGGLVAIDSAVGEGTTVWIALPLTESAMVARHATGATAAPVVPSHGRILLVEDDDAVRGVVQRVLGKAGYVLFEARDAAEAQEIWRQQDGAGHGIDLVITDVMMPGATGHELVHTLRNERRDVPVLFTSGYLDGGETRETDGGTTCYLEKPFTSRRLLDEVRALLAKHR